MPSGNVVFFLKKKEFCENAFGSIRPGDRSEEPPRMIGLCVFAEQKSKDFMELLLDLEMKRQYSMVISVHHICLNFLVDCAGVSRPLTVNPTGSPFLPIAESLHLVPTDLLSMLLMSSITLSTCMRTSKI